MKPLKDPEEFEKKALHKFMDFSNAHVLEIGCGEGRLTWKYAASSTLTVGVDPDQNALRIARADTPYSLQEKVRFLEQPPATSLFQKKPLILPS